MIEDDCEVLIGLHSDQLDKLSIDFRIIREDITYYTFTDDLVPDRYNIEIDNEVVTHVYKG